MVHILALFIAYLFSIRNQSCKKKKLVLQTFLKRNVLYSTGSNNCLESLNSKLHILRVILYAKILSILINNKILYVKSLFINITVTFTFFLFFKQGSKTITLLSSGKVLQCPSGHKQVTTKPSPGKKHRGVKEGPHKARQANGPHQRRPSLSCP